MLSESQRAKMSYVYFHVDPMIRLPHPIPYQGSKRSLAPLISRYIPSGIRTFYEPFAGSAAMTIYAAHKHLARHFVLGDSLAPIIELWRSIVLNPVETSARYRSVWETQKPGDIGYFNVVRARYNAQHDPVDLLYLIARCVKNAVRFNPRGAFTQSVDKRRLGMHPKKMDAAIAGVSHLLRGRTEFHVGNWIDVLSDAGLADFAYLDPPYLGTSIGRDKRYHKQMALEDLCAGVRQLVQRGIRLALSYDGMTGDKEYGPPLPNELGLVRLLLHAGRSSQATLQGRHAETIESLYVSPDLGPPIAGVIKPAKPKQESFAL